MENREPWNVVTSVANMTSNSTDSDEYYYDYDEDLMKARDAKIYTKFYMLAVMLPVGLFFNSFAFVVLLRSKNLRRTTTGRLLLALTIADNLYLTGETNEIYYIIALKFPRNACVHDP